MVRSGPWRVPTRGELSRDELLRCGVDVLLDEGWARLTVRGVARRAGTSPSLLCYHFGGVDRLRRAVVGEVVLDMLLPLLRLMCTRSTWHEGVVAVLEHVQDESTRQADVVAATSEHDDLVGYGAAPPSQRHVLAEVVVASLEDAVVREVVEESLDLAREHLLDWFEDIGVAAEHRDGAAVLTVALLDGLLLHRVVDPRLDLPRAAAALAACSPQSARSAGTTSCSNSSMPLVS